MMGHTLLAELRSATELPLYFALRCVLVPPLRTRRGSVRMYWGDHYLVGFRLLVVEMVLQEFLQYCWLLLHWVHAIQLRLLPHLGRQSARDR